VDEPENRDGGDTREGRGAREAGGAGDAGRTGDADHAGDAGDAGDAGELAKVRAEQLTEARALVETLAALSGLRTLPGVTLHAEPLPLTALGQSVDTLSRAVHLPGPLRLEVLARLVKARLTSSQNLAHVDVDSVARSLVKTERRADGHNVAAELTNALESWTVGTEPLGRLTVADLEDHDHLAWQLSEDIACSALTVRPGCGAASTSVRGVEAVSIVTELLTCKPFHEFWDIVNPLRWPDCWLESLFFKAMDPQAPPPAVPTPAPDPGALPPQPGGWQQTLLETVDFGFTIPGNTSQYLKTQLDFLFFWNEPVDGVMGGAGNHPSVGFAPAPPPPPGLATGPATAAPATPVITRSPAGAGGCTYDLKRSVGNRILVDQGFLLVEDLPGYDYRRYRTQKEIRFAFGEPPGSVCSFWSLATGMIMQGC
jgi:hypothetical protein